MGKTHLVEGQGVIEEHVTPDQSDAEFEMTKHVVAVVLSQGLGKKKIKINHGFKTNKQNPLQQNIWNKSHSIINKLQAVRS